LEVPVVVSVGIERKFGFLVPTQNFKIDNTNSGFGTTEQ